MWLFERGSILLVLIRVHPEISSTLSKTSDDSAQPVDDFLHVPASPSVSFESVSHGYPPAEVGEDEQEQFRRPLPSPGSEQRFSS
jgi:hypothetical protein